MNRSTKELILANTDSPPKTFQVMITRYLNKRHVIFGSFKIDAQTGKVWDENYSPKLEEPPTARDFEDIQKTLLDGRTAGFYPKESGWPGTYHWQAEYAGNVSFFLPHLHVATDRWEISGPILKDPDARYTYVWRFYNLTPEQHNFMDEHGEELHANLNERDYEGTIRSYEGFVEATVGRFWVTGDIKLAPTRRTGNWDDWSGEVRRRRPR